MTWCHIGWAWPGVVLRSIRMQAVWDGVLDEALTPLLEDRQRKGYFLRVPLWDDAGTPFPEYAPVSFKRLA